MEGRYSVSTYGRVQSHLYTRILKQQTHALGYKTVCLFGADKKKRLKLVHRLVATAFLRSTGDRDQVNHKDGDKTNNRLENLEWVTAKQNIRHAVATGLHQGPEGEKNGHAKLDKDAVLAIRRRYRHGLGHALAREYGVSRTTITDIVKRRSWAHLAEG